MSLLLDALKRAEQEKQLSRGAASEREPVITPMAANAPSASAPAASSLELQPIGGAAGAATARSEAAAHAAQAVFQAKQPLPAEGKGRGVVWAIVGVIVVVLAAAGAYVWMQVRQLTPARPQVYTPVRPVTTSTQPAMPDLAAVAARADPVTPRPADAAASSEAAKVFVPEPPLQPAPAAPRPSREALARQLLQEQAAAPAAAQPPVKLARSAEPPRLSADVSSGYQALRGGDLGAARRHYQAALAADPRSLDALLGMGTVEARSGNRPAAAGQYRRALDVDPRNATALAALASLADAAASGAVEPQLLQDIARTPGNAALHLALGNLYAGEGRWNDAQAAYFEAHRLDPASADILFNLAVALDQLGKGRLAALFYRQALEAARGQAPQFDPAAARRRAAALEAGEQR